ncbi:RNA polymerase I specific transcription initiation factor RRN3 [Macleaya cordata]|uniref:RNA polymerase I specific transcription initiation factor RRN3 n=1 Tax=Macleaya cordata TaxID=56857 RepID=A0A200PSD6_MACCD|nr:RNA polymerase I specific transcription initiation factor RRN3 [Macleaya cordata]
MGVELASMDMEGYFETADIEFSDSEIVSHVRKALRSVAQGDTDDYNHLIGGLNLTEHLTPDDVGILLSGLKGLAGAVTYIDMVQHEALLSAIFGMSLWNRDYEPDVMDALVDLIIRLATSSGKFVDSSLDMLISNFIPPHYALYGLNQHFWQTKKAQVLDRVHSALKNITDLVPLAPLRLSPIILQRMPHTFAKEAVIVVYVENMLRLESSAIGEFVGSTMLMAVVDRLIDLDVEIGWDDILQDDSSKGIFDMELDGDDSDDELANHSLGANVFAGTLDSLMVLTCEHLNSCADSGRLEKVFQTLLQSFHVTVLNAYKSKFAQFVIFYACSLDPETCGVGFAVMLEEIFLCKTYTYPPLTRMSAVAYLASYLSRAKFLQSSVILSILKSLVDWCLEYCQLQDGAEKIVNPQAHRVFYSACQAIMYVLCFRMRSMWDIPHLKSQIIQFPLESILQHPLDPLKVCLPSIVEEFLRQAKAASLFTASENFLFNNLLETDFSKAYGGMERLDMFFPFDPCLLRKCDRFIRPNFIYWAKIRTTYDDDEDFSSDEDDANEQFGDEIYDGFSDDGMGRSFDDRDLDLDEFENSLNKMSITPKSSLKYNMEGGGFNIPMRMPARIRPSTSPESL